jgi:hypothetical protein
VLQKSQRLMTKCSMKSIGLLAGAAPHQYLDG